MPDPMVREIGRVADIDGDPTIIGVDYDAVIIEPLVQQARLAGAQLEEFAKLFVSACAAAGYNKARMEEDAPDA